MVVTTKLAYCLPPEALAQPEKDLPAWNGKTIGDLEDRTSLAVARFKKANAKLIGVRDWREQQVILIANEGGDVAGEE